MTLVFVLFGLSALFEICCWILPALSRQRLFSGFILLVIAATSTLLMDVMPSVWTVLVFILSGYRIVNLLRVTAGRIQPDYLYRVARQASLWLIAGQCCILLIAVAIARYQPAVSFWLTIAVITQFIAAAALVFGLRRSLIKTTASAQDANFTDKDLPTLTVAIPARNETTDLDECLQSLVASNYPKLEVLVLDDCSQNRRTPEIIRSFAHDGIRFIAGQVPPEYWLAKNYAYQQLADEANGSLLLYCGVDVRFEPTTLRNIVATMIQKQKTMVSVMPINVSAKRPSIRQHLVQPARYGWELALPRRFFNRPPVLSTCWLIQSDQLRSAGGFKAVSRSIAPESYFARLIAKRNDGYSFVRSNATIGLKSDKLLSEQLATATRTRYPQVHRRMELVAFIGLIELFVLVGPYVFLALGIIDRQTLLLFGSLLTVFILGYLGRLLSTTTYSQTRFYSLIVIPAIGLYDVGLLNYSLWKYEFSTVYWKGRNVCEPVMRVFHSLPKTDA